MDSLSSGWTLGSQAASSGETLVIDASLSQSIQYKTLPILAPQILLIKAATAN